MHYTNLEEIKSSSSSDEQLLYRQLVQGLPIAIYGCDAQGIITFSNQAATALWGREAIPGKDLWCGSWKIFRPDGSPLPLEECPMAIALEEGRVVQGHEIIIERPDGTRCNVLPHPQPIFNDEGIVVGVVNSLVDITQQKKDQKALDELERSNNELVSFSYIASHDLQEPLRKVITFSDKLKKLTDDLMPAAGKEYLDKIVSSSERMRSLIEDVLNFSRVSNTDKGFIQVDLNEIIKDTLIDFDHRIVETQAKINISGLPSVQGCPLLLNQLFHNLIGNALKFSNTDPLINIFSEMLSEEERDEYPKLNKNTSYVKLIVKDNGIGFDREYTEQIFTIFKRLHGQSQYSGTGIGLALCRKIVENHKGIIYAKSQEGEGAEFHIIFPAV